MNEHHTAETFYRIFRDISRLVHSKTQIEEVLNLVVKKSTDVLDAKGALLLILNADTHQFELAAVYGMGEQYPNEHPVPSQTLLTDEILQNRVLVIKDIRSGHRVEYPHLAEEEGISMILDVPLTLGVQVVGIIRVYLAEKRDFSDEELDFIVSIAEQCACAINKAKLLEKSRAQYDQLALQTEKLSALGRMAAGIAHEINNPLAGILLYSTNMLKKVPEESPLKEGLQVITRETTRCKGIIQELLEFSRGTEPKKMRHNINHIIQKALSVLDNEFRLRHIRLEPRLGTITDSLLDENQMEQVFVNLMLNAAEAIEENGQITISSHMNPAGKAMIVRIQDTGCGIPAENLPKLFEPFFSTKSKGTGLGLAVSYGIVRNHGGNIHVSSQPEKGTCFTIELPV